MAAVRYIEPAKLALAKQLAFNVGVDATNALQTNRINIESGEPRAITSVTLTYPDAAWVEEQERVQTAYTDYAYEVGARIRERVLAVILEELGEGQEL